MVPCGFKIACLRASCPTSRSPASVYATTDGVVREPSALGITTGFPASVAAITELVVPRSIPTAAAITTSHRTSPHDHPRVPSRHRPDVVKQGSRVWASLGRQRAILERDLVRLCCHPDHLRGRH